MREGAWGLLLGAWLCACGEGDGGGEGALPVDSAGPWSQEAVLDYSKQFAVGTPQSVGLDEGGNLWLLDGARVGVLRPGDSQPTWTSGVGQAGKGFRSSVVCGGGAGRAYVGYLAEDLEQPRRDDLDDPVFLEGDLDVVRLRPDGGVALEQHLVIRNTNDPHYDEDRSVLTCVRVARGAFRGELYLGTNHGVTRVRGLDYNAHRHPVFKNASGSLRIGYTYAVGLAQDGDVLVGNEWKVGIVTPPASLGDWDDLAKVPWKLDTYVEALGSQEDMDLWRGFVQTKDGAYWLGSAKYGVWRLTPSPRAYERLEGLPTQRIRALAATPDGALLVGTEDRGLWRRAPDGTLARVEGVAGERVLQLMVDDGLRPAMVLALTEQGLTVLRVR
ncbi:hypothetical protein D187_003947 [Cystobacter fuscus DSM 2262]|uniref:Lipoprotein n=1 Tax=Cystobacter fuscus (strain ATCC 25194 / DSM 2262 / NBRC 100088 / M29) TaxID=1242864 RepID=S9P1X4_CYSF2|nr:hypothetical protein [Cystobacter fuscus]EPX58475.1 hypothetical protein D187_003947 [Cystobacter fuscus DSM 2262]